MLCYMIMNSHCFVSAILIFLKHFPCLVFERAKLLFQYRTTVKDCGNIFRFSFAVCLFM